MQRPNGLSAAVANSEPPPSIDRLLGLLSTPNPDAEPRSASIGPTPPPPVSTTVVKKPAASKAAEYSLDKLAEAGVRNEEANRRVPTTFRMPVFLNRAIEDYIYMTKRDHGVKVKKEDVITQCLIQGLRCVPPDGFEF
jgi:hypothetical protein